MLQILIIIENLLLIIYRKFVTNSWFILATCVFNHPLQLGDFSLAEKGYSEELNKISMKEIYKNSDFYTKFYG